MDGKAPVIAGIGEILWDMFSEGKQLGGAPMNFIYHAHMLGADAYVASRVGNDALGREIMDRIHKLNLHSEFIQTDEEHPTGTVSVKLDQGGQPSYVIHEGTAWDNILFDAKLDALAQKADAICFGSLGQRSSVSRETIGKFLKAASSNCLKVFDINLRQHYFDRGVIFDSLEKASVLKLNDSELPVVSQMLSIEGSEQEVLQKLISMFSLKMIALTRGGNGSLLVTPERSSEHHGFPARITDTVGAGDSFTAAMTVGLSRNYDLDKINIFANRIASYVCTCRGGTPEMPEELLRLE